MKLEGQTIQEAANSLTKLRRYAQYRFGGRWFLGLVDNQAYAFRTKAPLKARAAKAGMNSIDMFVMG